MTTENLERAFAATRAVLSNVTLDQLSDPTPCASWQVRDVINHIIGGSFYFAETVNDGKGTSPSEADFTGPEMVATFDDGIAQTVAAFNAPGSMQRSVELPFGTLPMPAWLGIATTDILTHGWDLAKATGQSTDLDPELAAQLLEASKAFIQPALRGEDTKSPFGAEQPAPSGGSNADQLAAFLGRHV
jgi:uncharacterized protein (TIGR03086 family)